MSTAGLFAGIVSTGGCEPSSSAASSGSAFWCPEAVKPQSVADSRLPPSSIAEVRAAAQLAGDRTLAVAEFES